MRPALLCRQLAANDLGAGAQGMQFAGRDMARQRRHTAVGGRVEFVGIDERQRLAQGFSHFFRGFDSMTGDIDRPDHHLFTADQFQQIHRHPRVVALERDNIEGGFLQLREGLLILSPLRTQRFFQSVFALMP